MESLIRIIEIAGTYVVGAVVLAVPSSILAYLLARAVSKAYFTSRAEFEDRHNH